MVSKRANSRTTLWNTAHDSRLNSEDYDIEVTEEDLKDRFDYNSPIFCMALQDYFDPYDEEQLSFVAGQLIKVLGQDNEKGLVFGEIGRKRGFCPKNLLTEIVQSSIVLNDAESPQWENVHFFIWLHKIETKQLRRYLPISVYTVQGFKIQIRIHVWSFNFLTNFFSYSFFFQILQ